MRLKLCVKRIIWPFTYLSIFIKRFKQLCVLLLLSLDLPQQLPRSFMLRRGGTVGVLEVEVSVINILILRPRGAFANMAAVLSTFSATGDNY